MFFLCLWTSHAQSVCTYSIRGYEANFVFLKKWSLRKSYKGSMLCMYVRIGLFSNTFYNSMCPSRKCSKDFIYQVWTKKNKVVFLCRSYAETEDRFRSGRQSKNCVEQRCVFILSVCVLGKQHLRDRWGDVLQYWTTFSHTYALHVFWFSNTIKTFLQQGWSVTAQGYSAWVSSLALQNSKLYSW